MTDHNVPQFPRGFVYAKHSIMPPEGFIPGPLLHNFYVHSWTTVDSATADSQFVVILGTCVPTQNMPNTNAADNLLLALQSSEEKFLELLDKYSGRYAVIFGTPNDVKIVNDATSMRSVFYSKTGGVVASHALLVEQAMGGGVEKSRLPFKYGFPGNLTPFSRTRLLTANTLYSISNREVRRFWPSSAPATLTIDQAAHKALSAATNAMQFLGADRKVKVALTAGLDSRVILAVVLNSNVSFETYTYGDGPDTQRDRVFARDLARLIGVRHHSVPSTRNSAELREALDASHYQAHHAKNVQGLMEYFREAQSIAVSGNLLEIGRGNYTPARKAGIPAPATVETMVNLHYRKMAPRLRKELADFGHDLADEISRKAFSQFVKETDYLSTAGLLDPFDQFYWEHRMSSWFGAAMNERDFYAEAFVPFNSREIFQALLGVSRRERDRAAVFYKMIQMVDDRLLDLPINPKRWPL